VLGQAFAVTERRGRTEGRGRTARIGRPRSAGSRFAVVLVAAVLAACGPSSSPGSSPGAPAGSATPSPAAEASEAPVLPAGAELPIRAITYSEDRASPLMAVAELDANKADVARLEFYRDPTGALRSVVAFHGDGALSVLTFDAQGQLGAVESRGYRVDFAYTETEVEATITGPDGAVVQRRGPIDPATGAALPAASPARPASARTVLAEPQMAPYPMVVESFGVVPVEVRYSGKSRDPSYMHVRFDNEGCMPSADINCEARLMTMWHDGTPTLVALVRTWVYLPDDPQAPGVVWRTPADCDSFTSEWETSLKWSGWLQIVGAGLAGAASLVGYSSPPVSVTIFLVGVNLKVLGAGTAVFLPKDCWLAPNLLNVRQAALNQKAGATATLTVTATGDCGVAPTTGWRIKEPRRSALTLQPLLPNNQSRFDQPGSGPELYYLPKMATITVDAADCGKEMTGKVDLKILYPTAAALAAINKLVTENRVALTLTEVDGNPDVKATVTGELTLTIRLDGPALWRLHSGVGEAVFGVDAEPMPPEWADCAITATTTGALEGKQSTAGGQGLKGLATITAASTISGCEDTDANLGADPKPVTVEKVPWTAAGDDAAMRGIVHLAGTTKENTYDLPFVVRAKATTP
jgi:hypothetical protein